MSRFSRWSLAVLVAVLSLPPVASPVTAYPGALDPGLDGHGIAVLDAGRGDDRAFAIVRQADGAVVTAGIAEVESNDQAVTLTRTLPDGSLDAAFGRAGRVRTVVPIDILPRVRLAAMADGRLVAATSDRAAVIVLRYLPTGQPDTSFGTGGRVDVALPSGDRTIGRTLLGLQPSTGQVVVGTTVLRSGGGAEPFLTRLLASGAVDVIFGLLGRALLLRDAGQNQIESLSFGPDGRIVVAGTGPNPVTFDRAMAVVGRAALTDALGRVVLMGDSDSASGVGGGVAVVVRLLPNGLLDPTFAVGGALIVNSMPRTFAPMSMAVDSLGRIVVAGGTALLPGDEDVWVLRLLPTGLPDPTFGLLGSAVVDVGWARDDGAHDLVLDQDRPVVAGFTEQDAVIVA